MKLNSKFKFDIKLKKVLIQTKVSLKSDQKPNMKFKSVLH